MKEILIIDDNPSHRLLIKEIIIDCIEEVNISEASDGKSGLDMLSKRHFDLVLVDNNLPLITGLEFIKASKELIGDTPLVMVTGSGSEDVAARAFKAGVTDYIVKGNDLPKRLSSMVIELLNNPKTCNNNTPTANLSSCESAMVLINSMQEEMLKDGFVPGLQQNMIVEFTQISDFNSFTRWAKNKKNVILNKVEILENKYVILLSISPRSINRIA